MRSDSVQIPRQRLGRQTAPALGSTGFERELAELAQAARERIRSAGNPLASLTPAEIDASHAGDAPEIIGRLPRHENERRT